MYSIDRGSLLSIFTDVLTAWFSDRGFETIKRCLRGTFLGRFGGVVPEVVKMRLLAWSWDNLWLGPWRVQNGRFGASLVDLVTPSSKCPKWRFWGCLGRFGGLVVGVVKISFGRVIWSDSGGMWSKCAKWSFWWSAGLIWGPILEVLKIIMW